MDDFLTMQKPPCMPGGQAGHAALGIGFHRSGHLVVIETIGRERETITALTAQLALRGAFNLIAGDEWLPDRDTFCRAVRRHTLEVEETLARPNLMRPMTCHPRSGGLRE